MSNDFTNRDIKIVKRSYGEKAKTLNSFDFFSDEYLEITNYKPPTKAQISLFLRHIYWCQRKLSNKYNPKFTRYLQRKGKKKWKDPCDVYLYQTIIPEIKKFGIANDHFQRASSSGIPNRYQNCLAVYTLPTRSDALLLESYLKKNLKRPKITDEIRRLLNNSDELTLSEDDHFHKVMQEGINVLSKDGAEALIDSMTPKLPEIPDGKLNKSFIRNNLKGKSLMLWTTSEAALKGEIVNYPHEDVFSLGWNRNIGWIDSDGFVDEKVDIKSLKINLNYSSWKEKYNQNRPFLPRLVNWEKLCLKINEDVKSDTIRFDKRPLGVFNHIYTDEINKLIEEEDQEYLESKDNLENDFDKEEMGNIDDNDLAEQYISNKRYQELLMLANTDQPLEEGATEEEKKFYEEAKNSYKNMIDNAEELGIKNPVQYIPMDID